jgi:hypothetical protein
MLSKKPLVLAEWSLVTLLTLGAALVESSQHDILPHHASDIIGKAITI